MQGLNFLAFISSVKGRMFTLERGGAGFLGQFLNLFLLRNSGAQFLSGQ